MPYAAETAAITNDGGAGPAAELEVVDLGLPSQSAQTITWWLTMVSRQVNPYALPQLVESGRRVRPSILWALFFSVILAISCGVGLFVLGGFIGGHLFDANPAYWFEEIYGWDIHENPESMGKVRIQTCLRFAINLGAVGFWGGLAAPWIRFVCLLIRNKYLAMGDKGGR